MIKRFNEVINIISDSSKSNDALNKVQYEINNVIHNNLYNFMLPQKVKEIRSTLITLFVKMKELKSLPKVVDEKRNALLAQGRVIVQKLEPYTNVSYSKEEYQEVYERMGKRMLAQYLTTKPTLTVSCAVTTLSDAKKLVTEWEEMVGEKVTDNAFLNMISELKTFITEKIC